MRKAGIPASDVLRVKSRFRNIDADVVRWYTTLKGDIFADSVLCLRQNKNVKIAIIDEIGHNSWLIAN